MGDQRIPLESDAYYHIYNHAVGKENMFVEERNYEYFLNRVSKWILPVSDLLAYCLIPNHFHFLARIKPEKTLVEYFGEKLLSGPERTQSTEARSAINRNPNQEIRRYEQLDLLVVAQFGHCFNSYVQGFNKTYKRMGSLMKASFQRKRIETDDHMRRIVCYLHNNPVKHGIVSSPGSWKYSSYREIISGKPGIVDSREVIELFDSVENLEYVHKRLIGYELD